MKSESFIEEYISDTIFDHGQQFFRSAKYLSELEEYNTAVVAVNFAFSIELFLKSLKASKKMKHIVSNSYKLHDESLLKDSHKLTGLFKGLNGKMQNEIIAGYKNSYYDEFVIELERVNSVFIDWRYQYEGTTYVLHTSTLENVASFLSDYVSSKLKEQSAVVMGS